MSNARIKLRPHSPQELLALIESVDAFERLAGVRVATGLRDFFVSGEVSPAWLDRLRSGTIVDPWVHGFGVIDHETHRMIGSAGFKGPPDADGVVEIAYGIVPSFEGRGYATEAAAALVAFAASDERVGRLRAHTLPQNNASCRVLEKNGFVRIGEVVDPEDGLVWRWERSPQQSP